MLTYIDYENLLFENMMKKDCSGQLFEENLFNAIIEIGNDLMYGHREWDEEDSHLSECWVNFNNSNQEEIIIGGWNRCTGIELNATGIYTFLSNIQMTSREQIHMFLVFTLAHERCHREHGDICQYSNKEEHDAHPCELRAQQAGYEAIRNI